MKTRPKIGLINVADPRLGPERLKRIQADGEHYAAALDEVGVEAVCGAHVATDDTNARITLNAFQNGGFCGIILRCAWFLRSNVIARGHMAGIAKSFAKLCNIRILNNFSTER